MSFPSYVWIRVLRPRKLVSVFTIVNGSTPHLVLVNLSRGSCQLCSDLIACYLITLCQSSSSSATGPDVANVSYTFTKAQWKVR